MSEETGARDGLTVLKLGGSVITDKSEPETVDSEALGDAVAAIATYVESNANARLALVHGGGSFGHHHAATHAVSSTDGSRDATALVEIHRAMGELNDVVVSRLHAAGVPAVPVRPFSVARRSSAGLDLPSAQIATMLDEGFVPVLHGDVVVHEGLGGTILSGDDIVVALARSLAADRVGLCSTVPGVLDSSEQVIPEITAYEDVAQHLGGSDATDVTGGMAGKVRTLLELDSPAAVFSLDDLERFLESGTAGTLIR